MFPAAAALLRGPRWQYRDRLQAEPSPGRSSGYTGAMTSHRQKRFARSSLLVDDGVLRRRCDRIEALSHTSRSVPHTRHRWEEHVLVQEQAIVRAVPLPAKTAARDPLTLLAADLDSLGELPVHGDITLKNLLFDGRRLQLVDWEPAHHQVRDGRKKWMVTEPWVARSDRRSGILSPATDRIGFFAVAWLLLHRTHRTHRITDRRAFARAHHLGRAELVPVDEDTLTAMTHADIVELAMASRAWRWTKTTGTWA